jgi:hypothetical protein
VDQLLRPLEPVYVHAGLGYYQHQVSRQLILPLAKQASSLPPGGGRSPAVFAGFGFFALSAFSALSPASTSSGHCNI